MHCKRYRTALIPITNIPVSSLIWCWSCSWWLSSLAIRVSWSSIALIIWLLKSYFEKIPVDLEEAAFVDGASRVQILRHIIAPLSTPGLVVVGIYAFIGAYAQQFLFAITFNQKKEYMPIPSGLYEFIGYTTVKWNEMMAASLVGIAPVLIVFLFLQKYIVEGLTSGAVKN